MLQCKMRHKNESLKGGAMTYETTKLTTFPAFLKVSGRRVVIVGNGEEALAKCRLLGETDAHLVLVANEPSADLRKLVEAAGIEHVSATFDAAMLAGAVLAFGATGDNQADRNVVEAARAAGVLGNAVDQPDQCDFYTPALVTRAPLAIAIGTEGASPVLAQSIRARIDQMLPPALGSVLRLAQSYRHAVEMLLPKGNPRRQFWRSFFAGTPARFAGEGDLSQARRAASKMLKAGGVDAGHVALVGAGPGAEDLLTLRAQRLLMEADVIVYDALVPESLVAMGRRDAERIPVGKRKNCHLKSQKEIDALLVELGHAGKRVVRLKSGDPLIFGRAGEELTALRNAGISYEVVPGVTAAFAAAADFALPLTLRGVASSVVLTTGHDLKGDVLPDWARLAIGGATVAVYMGRTVAGDVAQQLMDAGLERSTPVAVVENASRREQRLFHGTLKDLPELAGMDEITGPAMVIIGEAVAGADISRAEPLAKHLRAKIPARME
jgi:uroporphyrin-III C-methyltransferase / precorrin-2 dehydrogenase / sirohydrochlorin ferrochelatase